VGKTSDKRIAEIEATQEALRESISEAKDLTAQTREILQKHKDRGRRLPG
jgi:phosphoserine phosphatase